MRPRTARAPAWPVDPHQPETTDPHARRHWSRRGSLALLLAATALLYVWGLGASGDANDFYAAAVQAGTKSWKAFFFGSFDSSNFITVDKPPASLWPMELSGRIFGFNSWSMLVPQAIIGVLTVWALYATVRRWFGHWAGILAGGLLAITPVAVLMFRFNNPDALMTLLIVVAAYCITRAIEAASTRWVVLTGLVMGFAFLAKGLQPYTVLPALAIAYLVAAPTRLRTRLWQLLAGAGAIVVGAGWWLLAVQLTPAADRPYIGGSGDNSPLGLAFGYNGLSRLSGGSAGGPSGGGGFDGSTGIGRMFSSLNGGQIAWLLPTALVALVALAVLPRRAARTDRVRAAAIVWGGWLLVTGLVLSFASGIIHTYYTIELAPAIAALVGAGAVTLWRAREHVAARLALAAGALVTGFWGYALLHRTPSFASWLSYLLPVLAIVAAVGVLLPRSALSRPAVLALGLVGVLTLAGGSGAYALDTAATAHTGSTPTAGPATSSRGGFGGGMRGGFGGDGRGGFPGGRPGGTSGGTPPAGVGAGQRPGGTSTTGGAGAPGGTGGRRHRRHRRRRCGREHQQRARAAAEGDVHDAGPRRRSARSRQARWSCPAARPSWRSAVSAVPTPRRRSPSSRPTCTRARSGTSSAAAPAARAAAAAGLVQRHQPVGGRALHGEDRRRQHRLRPDPGEVMTVTHPPVVATPSTPSSFSSPGDTDEGSRAGGRRRVLGGRLRREHMPLAVLLAGTAALYLIGLSESGWANQFYAAAAQAGSKSWKAFLFGSLDQSNFITVDKPPASLWVMDVSVKFFGVNSWAVLVPQALEGVAAVAVLYAAVTRVSTRTAGLLAGAALATTPVAALMFRFDNPDALLVLLMTGAAYATIRAVQQGRPRWLVVAGALIGFAFLTKMLQGLLVVPGFAAAYLVAAPIAMRKRIVHLLAAGAAMVVAAGWWIALVELWPAGSRPYIGGSTDNSILQLVFGYNGVGRLTGADNNGSVGGAGGGTTGGGFSSGQTGLFRLFGAEMGSQISWLLPAALVGLAALVLLTARRPRTDALRAAAIVWGGWLLVTGVVLSLASGIIHAYYTVALAPAIAALVGLGVAELWRARADVAARWTLAALVAAGARLELRPARPRDVAPAAALDRARSRASSRAPPC